MPTTWPCLKKSVSSFFFSIFYDCVCEADPSDPLTKAQQACMFAWLLWFLADKHAGIASTFSSESLFLSDTFFLNFLQTYLLTFYLTYLVTSCNYFFDTLFLQLLPILSITVEVRHATLNSRARGWGPARHTELAWSQLGSGTPYWTRRIAIEVRHATLNSRDHSWGPARHTEFAGSRLGSGTPHYIHELAVGARHAILNSQDRNWEPTRRRTTGRGGGGRRSTGGEETNIKSNNPHLTGGKNIIICWKYFLNSKINKLRLKKYNII